MAAEARPRAVISLGTNTIRVLVVRTGADGSLEQLTHRQAGTRLGEGLADRGTLAPAARARTLAAVVDFAAVARAYDAQLGLIATSAMRRASDASDFGRELEAATGVALEVLGGVAEARASFRGATHAAARDGARVAVLDVGGGSTECAVGRDGELADARSIEIGSVRITERFRDLGGRAPGAPARAAAHAARAEVARNLAPLRALAPVDRAIAVAGTALTLGAVTFGAHVERVAGRTLGRDEISATLERLLDLPLDARRDLPGMLPQRADVVPGGGLVLVGALEALGVAHVRLESDDLLLGYLMEAPGR